MARVKKQDGKATEALLQRDLKDCPVSEEWVCGYCEGPIISTPSGNLCEKHGGGPPTKPKPRQSPEIVAAIAEREVEIKKQQDEAIAKATAKRSKVVDASLDLVKTLEEADKEADKQAARDLVLGMNGAKPEKPIDARYPILVERLFTSKEWGPTLDKFEEWLQLSSRRTEEAYIRLAHEQGPEIVREMFDVYLQVRQAREQWELENDAMLGAMREQATRVLQSEKDRGSRNKSITEEDVAKKTASMFPDEWSNQEVRRKRNKAVEDRAKHDVEVATLRCKILDSMMARIR